jgi:hypothetical protein
MTHQFANRVFASILCLVLACAICAAGLSNTSQETYDIVILNGRVIDPETQRDQISNVGIRGEKISDGVTTTFGMDGGKTVDGVAPGQWLRHQSIAVDMPPN